MKQPTPHSVDAAPGKVTLSGDIDLHAAPDVRRGIEDALASEASGVVRLDLGGVTFIDSSGINELVRPLHEGYRVMLTEVSSVVERVLELTGVREILRG